MHKSRIILLDKEMFWVLNRNRASAIVSKLTNSNPESLLKSEPCDYFFDCHKTMVQMVKNALKEIRESLLMSKSELAREANVSPITITRIEEGKPCRLETKRKILLALGYSLSDSKKIFGE
ncbi:helix-turn-helix transcriptional regulator [Desulfosarcina sp.]|uniref:helix-turn-helix transcriptional regulator n=1 Tax=Desulfosarcina sp. TaxID=2027861 RepID=UPI003970ED1A